MNIPIDILNEISMHLDLKSIVMLYATTLDINQLCDNMYWKKYIIDIIAVLIINQNPLFYHNINTRNQQRIL